MRYGSSLFHGLVEAAGVGYDDCARFQITCPVCREAVFKGVLRRRDAHETHYFSHYRETPSAQVERCELRASSITEAEAEKAAAEARGQASAIFVARFRECVLRAGAVGGGPAYGSIHPGIGDAVRRMLARPTWCSLLRDVRDAARERVYGDPEFRRRPARGASAEPSVLWRQAQHDHAKSMLEHALAPGSERAWQFLASFAAYCGAAQARSGAQAQPEWAHALAELVHAPTELSLRRAVRRFAEMPDTDPDPGEARTNLLARALQEIGPPLWVILMAIPYEDILRETVGRMERPRWET